MLRGDTRVWYEAHWIEPELRLPDKDRKLEPQETKHYITRHQYNERNTFNKEGL